MRHIYAVYNMPRIRRAQNPFAPNDIENEEDVDLEENIEYLYNSGGVRK